MKKTACQNRLSLSKQLALCAVFAALCLTSTLLISIPLPNGYFNVGDVFVLLSGWCLGVWGIPAAAIGSALADVISGFALYAPATFLIKGATACLAFFVCKFLNKLFKKELLRAIPRFLSAIAAETAMLVGYFLFESILYGFAGAALALAGNAIQGSLCALCGTTLCAFLSSLSPLRKNFPALE